MEIDEYTKPTRNFVAKHCRKYNKPKVERDRKSDYSRKGKDKWKYEE